MSKENRLTIYTVTTIMHPEASSSGERCIGFFEDYQTAEDAVLKNSVDMWETIYDWVVIEKVKEGFYSHDIHSKWFHWEGKGYEDGKYVPVENPEPRVVGWGIG